MFSTRNIIIGVIAIVVVGTLAMYSMEMGPFAVKQDAQSEAIAKAMAGNTIAYSGKGRGGNTTIFYSEDGSMQAVTATVSTPLEGTWRAKAPGKFCQQYNGRDESCSSVVIEKDVAKFMNDDGKLQFEAKILPGNQIKPPEGKK